jgi:hypothetical protein
MAVTICSAIFFVCGKVGIRHRRIFSPTPPMLYSATSCDRIWRCLFYTLLSRTSHLFWPVEKIKKTGILKLKKYNITNFVLKYTRKLYKEEKIDSPFSCHDIRYYLLTEDGKDLTMKNSIKFSREIHKNIDTTIGYMNV